MTVTRHVNAVSIEAGSDLSARQFGLVYVTDEGRAELNTNQAGATASYGVLLNKPTGVGQAARVAINGSIVKCLGGGAIAERAWVGAGGPNAMGTSTTTDNAWVIGQAVSACGGSGQYFELLVQPQRY